MSAASGNLAGGADSGTLTAPVYTYAVGSPGENSGYAPNGNLLSYSDSVMGAWSFAYDHLNRLVTAENGTQLGTANWQPYFCWAYDSFGNRTAQSQSDQPFPAGHATNCNPNGSLYQNTIASFDAQNHVVSTNAPGYTWAPTYDGAGDIVVDGSNQYLYDAEGRICAVQNSGGGAFQYVYDAEGNRVGKGTITAWSCDATSNGFSQTAQYIVDMSGQQLTETDGAGNWKHTNVYAGGKLIGTYDTNGLHFHLDDPLGTRRVQTDANGVMEASYTSLPFGDDLSPPSLSIDPTENHFTGKERDTETGNDYFDARYYNSAMGRFLSPDWNIVAQPVPYAKLDNPQSLNLYSYLFNNPLDGVDPDGHAAYRELEAAFEGRAAMDQADKDAETKARIQTDPAENTYTFTLNGKSMSSLDAPDGRSVAAFSGLGADRNNPSKTGNLESGALPKGMYYIVDRPSGGRAENLRDFLHGTNRQTWFGLFREDGNIDDHTTVNGADRGNFRLHPVGPLGLSEGCITVNSLSDYVHMAFQLMSAKPTMIPGTDIRYYGTVTVK